MLAFGESLGITANGWIDIDRDRLELQGTVAPAYLINSLLGNIPIIGQLLGGGSQGLIAANYRLSGPTSDPAVAVNPLSALAPGVLRQLFAPLVGFPSAATAGGSEPAPRSCRSRRRNKRTTMHSGRTRACRLRPALSLIVPCASRSASETGCVSPATTRVVDAGAAALDQPARLAVGGGEAGAGEQLERGQAAFKRVARHRHLRQRLAGRCRPRTPRAPSRPLPRRRRGHAPARSPRSPAPSSPR